MRRLRVNAERCTPCAFVILPDCPSATSTRRYSDGGSLSDYFKTHARSEDAVAYFFQQFASALSYCHKKVLPTSPRSERLPLSDLLPFTSLPP